MTQLVAALFIFFPTIPLPQCAPSEQDQHVQLLLHSVTNHGADLFNRGDANGCYRLYEGALMTIRELADDHPDWQQSIDQAFEQAVAKGTVSQRAFALRKAIDQIRRDSSQAR
jgi:hypothetical protein